jgi:hypothetical protein|tara:strand:+ start:35 stop:415 length:381 start_codon:yes stop_codon:yes gene_type:complete
MDIFFIILIFLLLIFSPLILGSAFLGWQKGIRVIHKESGIKKSCYVGYSWTYFFFGFFVPIFRGEISIGIFHLIFSIVTFGLFQLVMPFLYNKQASVRLLLNGWELNDTAEKNLLASTKIGISKDK